MSDANRQTAVTRHTQLTDTHCHLDFNKFDEDRAAVIQRAIDAGLTRILIPSLTLNSSRAAVQLADSHPMLYAGVGVHPTEARTWDEATKEALRGIIFPDRVTPNEAMNDKNKKVVAIGEIGLDYYWDAAPPDLQKSILKEQLELAEACSLPVIIHLREKDDAEHGACASDLMEILEAWAGRLRRIKSPLAERPGVLHSFAGSRETAERGIALNFYIGVTGPITFKNAARKRETFAALPLDHLLIETDAPFLAPAPHRGKRNEPAFVGHIADKIAEIHSKRPEEVAAVTSANAARLFAW